MGLSIVTLHEQNQYCFIHYYKLVEPMGTERASVPFSIFSSKGFCNVKDVYQRERSSCKKAVKLRKGWQKLS